MRTVTFLSVFNRVVQLRGHDPATLPLTDAMAGQTAYYIEQWIRRGWEKDFWPEWTKVDERTPDTNSLIAWEQTGKDALGEVQGVYPTEKMAYLEQNKLSVAIRDTGIELRFTDGDGSTSWVKYRLRPPRFTATAYAGATAYAVGDVVYYATTGECYLCIKTSTGNAPTNTTYWTKQDLPRLLENVAVRGAFSELLRQNDQKRADYEEATALEELQRVWEVTFPQQGLTRTIDVLGR